MTKLKLCLAVILCLGCKDKKQENKIKQELTIFTNIILTTNSLKSGTFFRENTIYFVTIPYYTSPTNSEQLIFRVRAVDSVAAMGKIGATVWSEERWKEATNEIHQATDLSTNEKIKLTQPVINYVR